MLQASIKKQIQALATRKGAVLQAAGQLQQEAVLLRQKVGEAKKQEEGTHQHVAAQRRIAAREQKDCEGTVDTIADEVNRRCVGATAAATGHPCRRIADPAAYSAVCHSAGRPTS